MAIALMPSSVISTVPTTSKSTANILIAPKKMTKSDTEVTSSSGASPPKGLTGGLGSKGHHHGAAVYHHPTLGYAIPPPQPAKVARRNARERNRVKQVNCGFELLRSHIPSAAKHKKMSKVRALMKEILKQM